MDDNQYRWLQSYERSWEVIKEDENGSILNSVRRIKDHKERLISLNQQKRQSTVKSMMRHLVIIIDTSKHMTESDYRPNRYKVVIKLLSQFFEDFFDKNPISQISIITTSDSKAKIICDLTSDIKKLNKSLDSINSFENIPSLQNSLELAHSVLETIPTTSCREVLILFGSITTCDPGDIFATIKKFQNIFVSVITLCAEMYILKNLVTLTDGTHYVCLDEYHLKEVLYTFLNLPSNHKNFQNFTAQASLLRMGFPIHSHCESLSVCVCHMNASNIGFFCTQCGSKYCKLPTECQICGQILVLAPHLVRSYQRYFPLHQFLFEQKFLEACSACNQTIETTECYFCPKCRNQFCVSCNNFCHESLGFCPMCKY